MMRRRETRGSSALERAKIGLGLLLLILAAEAAGSIALAQPARGDAVCRGLAGAPRDASCHVR